MIRAPRQRILGSMEANGSAQDVFCYFIFYSWTIKSAVCVSAREQCRAYLFAISLRIFLNNFLLSNEQAQKRARKRGRASALTMCRKKVFLFLFQYPSPILSVLRSLNFFFLLFSCFAFFHCQHLAWRTDLTHFFSPTPITCALFRLYLFPLFLHLCYFLFVHFFFFLCCFHYEK